MLHDHPCLYHLRARERSAKLAYVDKQDERVRFLAKLPPDLHHQLKVAAAEHSKNMNDLVCEAIEMRLAMFGVAETPKMLEGGKQ